MAGDEVYGDEVTSGIDGYAESFLPPEEDEPWSCSCGSTETREVCQGDQCINVCAECGSDEP